MRAVIQRVNNASIAINGSLHAKIDKGLLIFIGIEDSDDHTDIEWLTGKIVKLRIFNDKHGVMNLSVSDIQGEIMVVSQFTLHASTVKGNRPSYYRASKPEFAVPCYNNFVFQLEKIFGHSIKTGIFGAEMKISLLNDGPVTLFIDTKKKD
ncbi:MAG: D-tyrosyl-tRNA(Tyr) deacylase [Bacteroidales bacterium]|nr:D-tyrosyl-tRNA(Tyr) deacylase [Bacteroidales bacterium]